MEFGMEWNCTIVLYTVFHNMTECLTIGNELNYNGLAWY